MIRHTFALMLISSAFFCVHADLDHQQKKDIQSVIKEYLLNSPEVVEDAINSLHLKRKKEQETAAIAVIEKKQNALFQNANDPIMGNPKGLKTIVVFLDPFCGHCRRFHEVLDKAVKKNPELRVVLKNLPILGAASVTAVTAMTAAQLQGPQAYEAMQSKIMETKESLSKEDFIKIASQIKSIDAKRFEKDLNSEKVAAQIKETIDLAQEIGVNGTPSLVIGKTFIEGGMPYEDLMKAVG